MTGQRLHWMLVPIPAGTFAYDDLMHIGMAAIARQHPDERSFTIHVDVMLPQYQRDTASDLDLLVCYADKPCEPNECDEWTEI